MEKSSKSGLKEIDVGKWAELVGQGTQNAVHGLSGMVGVEIKTVALDLKVIPAAKAADLVGGPENEVASIYLMITGAATGHIMLIYSKEVAFGLVDMLMGQQVGTTKELGEMESSALGEMGNITGSFFLNSVADNTGLRLMPSIPTVMIDMAGSILDSAVADVLQDHDELFAMEAIFAVGNQEISGTLLVLPTAEFMEVMVEHSKLIPKKGAQC
ncbi:MAG: chemotaxis protein CheC [Dehalococcoidia bacterium]|nr:chemotaxis protein CheC [Dehalococcoidia bacterium]